MMYRWCCHPLPLGPIVVVCKRWVLAYYRPYANTTHTGWSISGHTTPVGCLHKLHPNCLISSFLTVMLHALAQSLGYEWGQKDFLYDISASHLLHPLLTLKYCICILHDLLLPALRIHRLVYDLDIACVPLTGLPYFHPQTASTHL